MGQQNQPSQEKLPKEKLSPGVATDDESVETHVNKLMNRAESEVRENEDASLQDETYSFDEDNTDNDDFHDVDVEDFDVGEGEL